MYGSGCHIKASEREQRRLTGMLPGVECFHSEERLNLFSLERKRLGGGCNSFIHNYEGHEQGRHWKPFSVDIEGHTSEGKQEGRKGVNNNSSR